MYKRQVLAFKLATWELNPNLPKDGIFIMNEYAADPEAADRDYGANPPTCLLYTSKNLKKV